MIPVAYCNTDLNLIVNSSSQIIPVSAFSGEFLFR